MIYDLYKLCYRFVNNIDVEYKRKLVKIQDDTGLRLKINIAKNLVNRSPR